MHPHIHLGPLVINSFGLSMALAFASAWYLLKANIVLHGLSSVRADLLILVTTIAGVAGAKLYHALQDPARLLSQPSSILSGAGFAWSGGLIAGTIAIWAMAGVEGNSPLDQFDLASPSGAIGYAIGRVGCLLAGDGDYGVPTTLPWGMRFPRGNIPTFDRVHPTPIYESIVAALICCYLWRATGRAHRPGGILARYLLLSGTARFLVEFIRINPRTIFCFTEAQVMSAACVAAGVWLLLSARGWRLLTIPGATEPKISIRKERA
jgi:phosphatidylglycerol:prolipoprotein diacylglycerol transferase